MERWSMLNRVAYAREHRAQEFSVTEPGRVQLPNMVVNNVYCEALFRYLKIIAFKQVGGLRLERALEGLSSFFLRTSVKLAIHGHIAMVVVRAGDDVVSSTEDAAMDREVAAAVESEVARNAEELEVELEAEPEPALAVENDDDEEDGDA